MKNLPVYFEAEDDINVYRVEHNDERTIATIYTMARGDDGKLHDAGDPREIDLTQSKYYRDKHFDLSRDVIDAVYSRSDKARFEISDTDANGDVHKFVFAGDELSEFLNDKPVNRIMTDTDWHTAYAYATQMLQIYCDEPLFAIKDEAHDMMFGVYSSPNGGKYYVYNYREDDYGLSLVHSGTDWREYEESRLAIYNSKRYADPKAWFDKLVDFNCENEDWMELAISATYETQNGEITAKAKYSYGDEDWDFTEVKKRLGIEAPDKWSDEYDDFLEECFDEEYDEFVEYATQWFFDECSVNIDLHPVDEEKIAGLQGYGKWKYNPEACKVKDNKNLDTVER